MNVMRSGVVARLAECESGAAAAAEAVKRSHNERVEKVCTTTRDNATYLVPTHVLVHISLTTRTPALY